MADLINLPVRHDAAQYRPPAVSNALQNRMRDAVNGYDLAEVPFDVVEQARVAEAAYDRLCAPVSYEGVVAWLEPLAIGCKLPLSETDFEGRCAAIVPVLLDFPRVLFTPRTQREALTQFDYFPGAKGLYDFLSEKCRDWKRDHAALRKIVRAAERALLPDQPRLGEAERDAVLARFRTNLKAVHAERHANDPVERTVVTRPMHHNDEQLLANYERLAQIPGTMQVAAQTRVEMLRRKLGLDATTEGATR